MDGPFGSPTHAGVTTRLKPKQACQLILASLSFWHYLSRHSPDRVRASIKAQLSRRFRDVAHTQMSVTKKMRQSQPFLETGTCSWALNPSRRPIQNRVGEKVAGNFVLPKKRFLNQASTLNFLRVCGDEE